MRHLTLAVVENEAPPGASERKVTQEQWTCLMGDLAVTRPTIAAPVDFSPEVSAIEGRVKVAFPATLKIVTLVVQRDGAECGRVHRSGSMRCAEPAGHTGLHGHILLAWPDSECKESA